MNTACKINEFQLGSFLKIVDDIPESRLRESTPGHGHTPLWLLGHLAITGELGQMLLGGELTHRSWMPLFSPGSKDPVEANTDDLTKELLVGAVGDAYAQLRLMFTDAPAERLAAPHGIELFETSPIDTIGDAVTLLLTNHFAFHLSQLSAVRRTQGLPPLF